MIISGLLFSWITRRPEDEPTHPDLLCPLIYSTLPKDYKFKPNEYKCVMQEMHIITYNSDKEKEAMYINK